MSTEVSGTSTSPEDAAPDTRTRLIHAAAEVFREEGYERTRVSEVARRAGLTTGAIYANFRGKSELLREAIALGTAELLAQMAEERRAGASSRDVLEILARRVARPAPPLDRPLTIEAFAAARRDPDVAAQLRESLSGSAEQLTLTVASAKRHGDIDEAVDDLAFVRFCQSLAFGYYLLDLVGMPAPASEEWDVLTGRLLDALRPPSSG